MNDIFNFYHKDNRWLDLSSPAPVMYRGKEWANPLLAMCAARLVNYHLNFSSAPLDMNYWHATFSKSNTRLRAHRLYRNTAAANEWFTDTLNDNIYSDLEMLLRQKYSQSAFADKLANTGDAKLFDVSNPSDFSTGPLDLYIKMRPVDLRVSDRLHSLFQIRDALLAGDRQRWNYLSDRVGYGVYPEGKRPRIMETRHNIPRFHIGKDNDTLVLSDALGIWHRVENPAQLTSDQIVDLVMLNAYREPEDGGQSIAGLNFHGEILTQLRQEIQTYGMVRL